MIWQLSLSLSIVSKFSTFTRGFWNFTFKFMTSTLIIMLLKSINLKKKIHHFFKKEKQAKRWNCLVCMNRKMVPRAGAFYRLDLFVKNSINHLCCWLVVAKKISCHLRGFYLLNLVSKATALTALFLETHIQIKIYLK